MSEYNVNYSSLVHFFFSFFKLDPSIFESLQKERVEAGDVIYIEANSGAVKVTPQRPGGGKWPSLSTGPGVCGEGLLDLLPVYVYSSLLSLYLHSLTFS